MAVVETEDSEKQEGTACFVQVKKYDHDRFLTVLFAPKPLTEDLFTLYAFNHEIAKISSSVSEPMLGEIRLQWWRESLDSIYEYLAEKSKNPDAPNNIRRHSVVTPLTDTIEKYKLPKELFGGLIDGRTEDLYEENPKTIKDLEKYVNSTSGNLAILAGKIVGCEQEQALRSLGLAWGLLGIIRAVPFQVSLNKVFLPADLMNKHGLTLDDVKAVRNREALSAVIQEIDSLVENHLIDLKGYKGKIKGKEKSVFLLSSLTKSYRKTLKKAGYDPFKVFEAPDGFFRQMRLLYSSLFGII